MSTVYAIANQKGGVGKTTTAVNVAACIAAAGYDTLIGDGGRTLSPGERRRIAIARAFLRDAPLVILDEPTADLDPASVAVVAEAIARLRAGRTTLLIAHRPELVRRADRVVRLADGAALTEPERRAA